MLSLKRIVTIIIVMAVVCMPMESNASMANSKKDSNTIMSSDNQIILHIVSFTEHKYPKYSLKYSLTLADGNKSGAQTILVDLSPEISAFVARKPSLSGRKINISYISESLRGFTKKSDTIYEFQIQLRLQEAGTCWYTYTIDISDVWPDLFFNMDNLRIKECMEAVSANYVNWAGVYRIKGDSSYVCYVFTTMFSRYASIYCISGSNAGSFAVATWDGFVFNMDSITVPDAFEKWRMSMNGETIIAYSNHPLFRRNYDGTDEMYRYLGKAFDLTILGTDSLK